MKPFKRRRRGRIYAEFDAQEAHLIINLLSQVVELLRDRNGDEQSSPDPLFAQLGIGGSHLPPEDPVLKRLLPSAYLEDEEDAADFRRYTERGLTSAKVRNAEIVIASLIDSGLDPDHPEQAEGPIEVELDDATVQCWLRSLTDLRLSLAVRLGIESEQDAEAIAASEDEAALVMSEIYDWLGYVQETLIMALD